MAKGDDRKNRSEKVRMVPGTNIPYENWIQAWIVTNREKRKVAAIKYREKQLKENDI